MDAIPEFRAAIQRAGLTPPDEIIADGGMHRFPSNGKRGDVAGWYVLHDDGIPAGAFGCWRSDVRQTWCAKQDRELTEAERARHRERIEAANRQHEQAERERREHARQRAASEWEAAKPAPDSHPYLARKGVKSHGLRVADDGRLMVPVRDATGLLHSLQFINGDGDKRFLTGGQVRGGYFPIGSPDDVLCIAEGYATAATIREATGHAAAVAFNAGNLEPVARALRAKLPDVRLIVCADDDAATAGNPGMSKAAEAARTIGGFVAVPDFGPDRPERVSDFNDLAAVRGPDAVRACVSGAKAPDAPTGTPAESLQIISAAGVVPEPISWLWPGWLARGKLHVLAGAPGTGKTTLAITIAAIASVGGTWPDGSRAAPGNVLVWSGEDDPADTLVPRLIAARADLARVHFVGDVRSHGEPRPFDPATDVMLLDQKIADIGGVSLLIVDPIVNAVGGDSHKNADVRRSLAPLVAIGQRHDAAVLGISHFSKGSAGREPVERVTGSLAFGALARIVLIAARAKPGDDDSTDDAPRLFARAKSNIGRDDGGFHYNVKAGPINDRPGIETSWIEWRGAVHGSARDLLAEIEPTATDDGSAVGDAEQFLMDALRDGPVDVSVLRRHSAAAGHAWATVRRAKDRLGVTTAKGGMKAGWRWELPAEGALKTLTNPGHEHMSAFGMDERLRAAGADVETF